MVIDCLTTPDERPCVGYAPPFAQGKVAVRIALLTGCVLAFTPVLAAEPVRIGITTILSGTIGGSKRDQRADVRSAAFASKQTRANTQTVAPRSEWALA